MIRIHKIGILETDPPLKALRITLVNFIVLFSIPLLAFHMPLFLAENHSVSLLVFGIAIAGFGLVFWLNYKRKNEISIGLALAICNLTIFYTIISYGLSGESQAMFLLVITFAFILFDRIAIVGLMCLITFVLCFGSFIIVDNMPGSALLDRLFPYDYYLNFGAALLACCIISYFMTKALKTFVDNQSKHIEQLEVKNKLIETQNKEMDFFTTMASHDLRTPVRTIVSFLGLIEMKGDLKGSESEEYLNLAKSGANQLAELINGISAFKQLENDATLSNYRPSNKIINEVITNLPNEIKQNVEFTIETLPDVSVFHVHLYQLFQNLITNGLKYNESALKTLKVHYRITEEHIEYIVEDNGIGIDPEYLSYIFEPFKKLHSSNKYLGTGLGLAICKKILEMNNGDIYVSSNSKGSMFIMKFPLSMLRND